MKVNPIYKREMKVSSRSPRLPVMMLLFNGILALVALLSMYSVIAQVRITAEMKYTSFLDLYSFVAAIEFILILFIVPALTAGSISGEYEKQTIELLLVTDTTPAQVVIGKVAASLGSVLLLVISSFPVISLVFVYGGITFTDLLMVAALYLSTALLCAGTGIFFSAVSKKTTIATAASYGMLFFLVVGTYAINYFVSVLVNIGMSGYLSQIGGAIQQGSSGAFLLLLLFNPAITFFQVLNGQIPNPDLGGAEKLFAVNGPVLLARHWVAVSIILQLALAVLLIFLAVRSVTKSVRK